MDAIEMHGRFALMPDAAELLPEELEVSTRDTIDMTPALLTAAALLSGMIDDEVRPSDDELRDAVRHLVTLVRAEIVDVADWAHEAEQVVVFLLEWGDSSTFSQSELN